MTDNEIIKALELCKQNTVCKGCPYISNKMGCQVGLIGDTLDLINRLQEQNAALIAAQETLQKCIAEKDVKISELEYDLELMIQEKSVVQSKAIKEFANSIKRRLNSNPPRGAYLIDIVDNLVKEMVGDAE